MATLTEEYTDRKYIKHRVEHLVLPTADKSSREQILEELFRALTKPRKRLPA